MKVKELIKQLQEGVKLNPECKIYIGEEGEPYVSWDDLGDCVIYEVESD